MRYVGAIEWIDRAEESEGSGDITRCLIRQNEVVFEVAYDRYKYDVKLQQHGNIFNGTWVLREPQGDTGAVTCVVSL